MRINFINHEKLHVLRGLLFCSLLFLICHTARAQDFDIRQYDINVQLQPAANTAQIQAKLALTNITTQGRSGQSVTLKLNKNGKVSSVKVDGTDAQFRQKNDDRLTDLANVSIDFPKSVQPGATAT